MTREFVLADAASSQSNTTAIQTLTGGHVQLHFLGSIWQTRVHEVHVMDVCSFIVFYCVVSCYCSRWNGMVFLTASV